MARIILSMDGRVLKEHQLDKERTTIGREPENDIQIDNLAVSGCHAAIVTILNDSFLEDLGSTNGTLVNGNPVQKHFLENNDLIEIGKYKMKYIIEKAMNAEEDSDMGKTMVSRAPVKPAMPAPSAAVRTPDGTLNVAPMAVAAPAAPVAGIITPLAAIQILSGTNTGKEMDLTKTLTTLGKSGVQVAVITRRPQGYFITHIEGASLPRIDGKSLDVHPYQLKDHDIIELAGVKMEFFVKS